MSTDADKIRIRSPQELDRQAASLELLSSTLERVGAPHFLSGGTLLGAARDGDFIAWDWDVEVSLRSEEMQPLIDSIVRELELEGFVTRTIDEDRTNLKVVVQREGAVFEIRGYRRRGRRRIRRDFRTQDRFFRTTESVMLRGRRYPCLGPIDEYLTDRYGDWRTPVRSETKSDYLAPNYFRQPAWLRWTRVMLGAVIRRIRRLTGR